MTKSMEILDDKEAKKVQKSNGTFVFGGNKSNFFEKKSEAKNFRTSKKMIFCNKKRSRKFEKQMKDLQPKVFAVHLQKSLANRFSSMKHKNPLKITFKGT